MLHKVHSKMRLLLCPPSHVSAVPPGPGSNFLPLTPDLRPGLTYAAAPRLESAWIRTSGQTNSGSLYSPPSLALRLRSG